MDAVGEETSIFCRQCPLRRSPNSGSLAREGRSFVSDSGQLTAIGEFLSSPGDVADEGIEASQVLEELPKNPLLDGRTTFKVVSWGIFGCRFLAVVVASGIGKSSRVDASPDNAPGGAGRTP